MRQTSELDEATVPSPLGNLSIATTAEALVSLTFADPVQPLRPPTTPLGREVARQLDGYFADPHWRFTLPLAMSGTAFQQRVWQAMAAIPSGDTRSYGQVATALGSAARAVGGACRANPIPVIVPCHRIVATGGGLGGFSGAVDGTPLARKRWLLDHETHPR